MRFPSPLVRGSLIQRHKRFLADVVLDDGRAVTAACPNTGAMLGLAAPGSIVWLSESSNPARKYRHTWELTESGDGARTGCIHLVGINPLRPNAIVADAIASGAVPELAGYPLLRREVKYGRASRIDILLDGAAGPRAYVEVKNVHFSREPGLAEFPDCRTERGAKHLAELSDMAREGHRAVMLYCIQRDDARRFTLADHLDPAYAAAARDARTAGVEFLAYRCQVSTEQVRLARAVPVVF